MIFNNRFKNEENRKIGIAFIEIILLYCVFFLQALVVSFMAGVGKTLNTSDFGFSLSGSIVNIVADGTALFFLLYFMMVTKMSVSYKLTKKTPLYFVVIFISLLILILLVNIILPIIDSGLVSKESQPQWHIKSLQALPAVIILQIFVGYFEEGFFRVYILTRLDNLNVSRYISVISSSLLFAVGHFYEGLSAPIIAFVMGCGLSLFYFRFKDYHANALAHAGYNISVLMIAVFYHP